MAAVEGLAGRAAEVGGEFALGAGLILREFFQIFGEGKQAAVTILEDQQGTDIFEHGKGLVGGHGIDKFFACYKFWKQSFYRYTTTQEGVFDFIHDSHAATADLTNDFVAIVNDITKDV